MARVIHSNGDICYYNDKKQLHRLDGPAKRTYYTKEWFVNGKWHREDGPSYIYTDFYNGYVFEWFNHGIRHREYQPATIISDDLYHEFYYHGIYNEPYIYVSDFDEVQIWVVYGKNITNEIRKCMNDGKLDTDYTKWDIKQKAFFKLRFL